MSDAPQDSPPVEAPPEVQPAAQAAAIQRIVQGTAAMSLSFVVNIVGQVAVVPAMMHFWGAEKFGEWSSLGQLVQFLALTDLGLQGYVVNRMCAHHARGDTDQLLDDLHSSIRVQAPLVLLLIALGAACAAPLPLERWLNVTTTGHLDVYLAVVAMACEVLSGVPMGVIGATYRAAERLPRYALFATVRSLLLFLVPLVVVALGGGFAHVAFSRVAVVVLSFVWNVRDLYKIYPWFRLWPLRGSRESGLKMLGPGLIFMSLSLSDYLSQAGPITVLQTTSGGVEVSRFSTMRTWANLGRSFSNTVRGAVGPELTALSARGDMDGLARAHRTQARLHGLVVGAMMLASIPVANVFYGVWTMHEVQIDLVTMLLIVARSVLWGFWISGQTVLQYINRHERLAAVLFASSALGVGLCYVLVPEWGIRGAAVAGLIGDAVLAMWAIPLLTTHTVGEPAGRYWRATLPVLLLGLGLPTLIASAVWFALSDPIARMILVPIAGLLVGTVIAVRLLDDAERATAKGIGRKLLVSLRLLRPEGAARG